MMELPPPTTAVELSLTRSVPPLAPSPCLPGPPPPPAPGCTGPNPSPPPAGPTFPLPGWPSDTCPPVSCTTLNVTAKQRDPLKTQPLREAWGLGWGPREPLQRSPPGTWPYFHTSFCDSAQGGPLVAAKDLGSIKSEQKKTHNRGLGLSDPQACRSREPSSPLAGGEPLVVCQWPGPLERGRSHGLGGMSQGSRKECCKDKGVSRGTGHQRSAGLGIYKGRWAKLRPAAGRPGLVSTGPLSGSQRPPSSSGVCQLRACDLRPHRASAALHPARLSCCPSVSNPCLPIASCPAWPASPHVSPHFRHHSLSLAVPGSADLPSLRSEAR